MANFIVIYGVMLSAALSITDERFLLFVFQYRPLTIGVFTILFFSVTWFYSVLSLANSRVEISYSKQKNLRK